MQGWHQESVLTSASVLQVFATAEFLTSFSLSVLYGMLLSLANSFKSSKAEIHACLRGDTFPDSCRQAVLCSPAGAHTAVSHLAAVCGRVHLHHCTMLLLLEDLKVCEPLAPSIIFIVDKGKHL